MSTRLVELASEFLELRRILADAETAAEPATSELLRDEEFERRSERMSSLAREIVSLPAQSGIELVHKSRVALDWINQDGDLADRLAASVCHDVAKCYG